MLLSDAEIERYARQLVMPELGEAGQAKLRAARILVLGAGGLGAPVLAGLAGAGVGHVVERDLNLRQMPHSLSEARTPMMSISHHFRLESKIL